MKRAALSLEWVVIIALLAIFVIIVSFGLFPRFEKQGGILETLLPEKCDETGRTRAEYVSLMEDSLTAVPPNAAQALEIYNEMKRCFPDADAPADLKRFSVAAAQPKLAALAQQGTTQSVRDIVRIYDDSKGVIALRDWNAAALLTFARAMFHAGNPEARTVVAQALTLSLTDAQRAEALYIQAMVNDNADLKTKNYNELISRYSVYNVPEAQLYAGLALLGMLKDDAAIPPLVAAKKSSSPYVQGVANYKLGVAYWRLGVTMSSDVGRDRMFHDAADAYWNVLTNKDAIYFSQALDGYSKLDAKYRSMGDCAVDADIAIACICRTSQGVGMAVAGQYCCASGIAQKPCYCAAAQDCTAYRTQAHCDRNPCGFRPDPTFGGGCTWNGGQCAFVSIGMGGI